MSNDNSEPSIKVLLFLFVLIFGGVGFIFFLGCWATGSCEFQADSTIVEIGICLEQTSYEPTNLISLSADEIYLCGRIEGTTSRPGALYLFLEDAVVYSDNFGQKPGIFFKQLRKDKLALGNNYIIKIVYERKVLAQTEFMVKNTQ